MSASAASVMNRSFPHPVEKVEVQISTTQRKPVKRDSLFSALRPRPGVLAMREDAALIRMQWTVGGRRIRQIAKNYEVPRDAVEDLLREVCA